MTDLQYWLESAGLDEYADIFTANRIDSDVLLDLTEQDLEKLEIPLGDRKRFLKAITQSRSNHEPGETEPATQAISENPQRRQLTFVFADLVGSTALSDRLDPEEYRSIIQKVHEVYAKIIDQHQGWIAQYQGDGIFAYFGYPQAGEDDAERAVAAGLSIVTAINNIDLDMVLQVRVGVATGLVVVGDLVGEGIHEKYTVMGDTPNISSKMQLLAEPDAVIITDVSRQLLGRQFDCEDLGLKTIEGISQPIQMWLAKKVTTTATRFEARHMGKLTKFIGHKDEVALLQGLWQQCLGRGRSKAPNGQVVLISGEPGIGKSRLSQVMCERVTAKHATLYYQCSPHHKDSALHPVIMQLASKAGFEAGDSPQEKLEKLVSLLGESNNSASTIMPVFARLLSITLDQSYDLDGQTPAQIKDLTLQSLLDRCIYLSKQKPLLIVFEDLQWIDPTSQALLDLLITKINDMEAILLATFRPEYEAPASWVGQPHINTLNLSRLNRMQSSTVIAQQTDGHKLPQHLLEMIITKTDGVPLFLEEFTKATLESRAIELENGSYKLQGNLHEMTLPVSLQDSLMARLDRLPDARVLAPIGATIGRTFSYALLAAVTGLAAGSLRSGLDQLIDAQLLFEHGRLPDSTYTFKHALVQDVAYESQLKSSRARVNEKIATALISTEKNVSRSRPEVIAFHYQEAGKYDEAFNYWILAGTNGLEAGATAETVKLLQNACHLLSRFDETEANRPARLKYYILQGKALNASIGARSKDAELAFKNASVVAEKMGDIDAQIHALDSEFGIIFNSGDTKRSIAPAMAMIEVGKARNHRVGTICGLQSMGMIMFTRGEFIQARNYLKNALVDSNENITGINSYPSLALMYLAYTSYILGDKKNGLDYCEDSVASGRSEIPYSLAVSLGNSCYLYQFADDHQSIERNATELVNLARSKGQLMWLSRGLFFHHWLSANRDKSTESLLNMEQEVKKLLEANEEVEITYYLGLIASTQINLSLFDKASESLDLALQKVEKNGETFYHSQLLRLYGDLIRCGGAEWSHKNAENYYKKSLDIAKTQSAKLWEEKALSRLAPDERESDMPHEVT
jgi:class 3 adenylate cyclase